MNHRTQREVLAAIDDYAHRVLDNPPESDCAADDIPTCRLTQQCVDHYWLHDMWRAKNDPDFKYGFDLERATDAINFAEVQVITEGIPARLKLMDFHTFIVAMIYGWVSTETGRRRFRRAYISMARKSAKSVLAAVIVLNELRRPDDVGGQCFVGSVKAATAAIVFGKAKDLINQNSLMASVFGFETTTDTILHTPTNSVLTYLPGDNKKDSSRMDGLATSAAVIDETHMISADAGLLSSIALSTQARHESLIFEVTTAGFKSDSRAHETHEITKRVVCGQMRDETIFALYFGLDASDLGREDLFRNEYLWRKCTPGWGTSVIPEAFSANAAEAELQPSKRAAFMVKVCNAFSSGVGSFLPAAKFNAVKSTLPGLQYLQETQRECILGLDVATTSDLFGIGLFALETDTDIPYITTQGFAPPHTVQTVPYIAKAVEDGQLMTSHHSGDILDVDAVEAYLREIIENLNIVAVYYDPAGMKMISAKLLKDYPSLNVAYVAQNHVQLSPALQYLQETILASAHKPAINMDLRGVNERLWRNLDVEYNKEGLMRPLKTRYDNFIDPPVAAIIAVAGHLQWKWYHANKRPDRDLSKVESFPLAAF